ncbi:hypothetical protein IMZ29_01430 [Achromobacter sp. GG226]|uniref:COG4315 family predicted lipoprotein n=1 Tax=Verticiella alkaliphila TaxID=2779529 RepID=UPI001C0BC081|nr:hypothetical protein [Verticiella sp. GG226]MBU4609257.1 hypothetical protein [Verticiella sp. GG226]
MKRVRLTLLAAALALAGHAAYAAVPAKAAGGMLVDADGMTLYTFDKDVANSGKSTCNGPCADLWPPLAASATAAPEGDYTVVTRDDGTKQWAHKGLPLYRYKSDAKPGDKTGDGFKSVWHVVKP